MTTTSIDEPTAEMIEAGLADLRDRRLLKWLFSTDNDPQPIGPVDGPIDLETQREIVSSLYTAMRAHDPALKECVEALERDAEFLRRLMADDAIILASTIEAEVSRIDATLAAMTKGEE